LIVIFSIRARSFVLALVMTLAASAPAQPFVHPGGLHTRADLDRIRAYHTSSYSAYSNIAQSEKLTSSMK
jgi:hypothetical protein